MLQHMASAPRTFTYPQVTPMGSKRAVETSKELTQRELVSASLLRVPPKA
jgi:hypothetical protein